MKLKFKYSDGGRAADGFITKARGDCAVRSVAIASGRSYIQVYKDINDIVAGFNVGLIDYYAAVNGYDMSAEAGVSVFVIEEYLNILGGWQRVQLNPIKSMLYKWVGLTYSADLDDVPRSGTFLVHTEKHISAVVDGVIYDTADIHKTHLDTKILNLWRKL